MQSVKVEESTRFSCGVEGEIFRDVERTYQTSPVFQEDGIGRDMLTKLLLAFVATFPKVGYCQVIPLFFPPFSVILSIYNI